MKKKNKKYFRWTILIIIIAFFIALPSMINTKEQVSFKSQDVLLKGNYYWNSDTCENDECTRSYCLNSDEISEDIMDYKVCLCCVNFDYKEEKSGQKVWKVKDYKLKIFYKENGKELEKPFFTSNPSTEFPIPNLKRRFLSINSEYSEPYHYTEDYPNKIQFSFHRIRISYRKILEFLTSQG